MIVTKKQHLFVVTVLLLLLPTTFDTFFVFDCTNCVSVRVGQASILLHYILSNFVTFTLHDITYTLHYITYTLHYITYTLHYIT